MTKPRLHDWAGRVRPAPRRDAVGLTADSSFRLAIPALIEALHSEDAARRERARASLALIGRTATPAVVGLLQSAHEQDRWEAAKILTATADPAAGEALVEALRDESMDVRWLAAEALVRLGRDALPPLLRALMHRPRSFLLREGAHHVLLYLPRTAELEPLRHALEGFAAEALVPSAARELLEQLDTPAPRWVAN